MAESALMVLPSLVFPSPIRPEQVPSGSTVAVPGQHVAAVTSAGEALILTNAAVNDDEDTLSSKQKSKVKKKKTEPSNPYLQFVKNRKERGRIIDPRSKLNMKDVQMEWGELTEAEKLPFRKMFQKEKRDMGEGFRNKGQSEKYEKDAKSKPLKKKRKSRKKGLLDNKSMPVVEKKKSLKSMMEKYKEVDEEIEKADLEAETLYDEKLKINIELAANKTKFQMLTDSLLALKEKYTNVNKRHKNCSV